MINALNLVKKNGYLIISVPAYSHLYSKFDEEVGHYRRYEKKDIKTILKDVNFAKLYLKNVQMYQFIICGRSLT